jgi:hypothetical protein
VHGRRRWRRRKQRWGVTLKRKATTSPGFEILKRRPVSVLASFTINNLAIDKYQISFLTSLPFATLNSERSASETNLEDLNDICKILCQGFSLWLHMLYPGLRRL